MKRRIIKIFIAVSGIIFGFNVPIVAQYGAPENFYYRQKMIEDRQRFVVPLDTSACSESYIVFENLKSSDSQSVNILDADTPATVFSDATSPPGIIVYPNPCSEKAKIRITNPAGKACTITLFTINGLLLSVWNTAEN